MEKLTLTKALDILDIKDFSIENIKSSYKRLAKKYHPDICKEDNCIDKFNTIREAYDFLMSHVSNVGNKEAFFVNINEDISDIFKRSGFSFGFNDVKRQRIYLTVKEAYIGGVIQLKNGHEVPFPSRIKNGTLLKVKDLNLELKVYIKSIDNFEVINDNIYTELEIDLYTMIFGGTINFNFFDKNIKVKVKKDSEPNDEIIIKNKGLKDGDLIIKLKLKLPKSNEINKEDLKELLGRR